MKGLVKIREKDWHFKLIKYCWGINPKVFKNLCPYFWLTMASILLVLPIAFWRHLIAKPWKSMVKALDESMEKSYEGKIKSLNRRQAARLLLGNDKIEGKDRWEIENDIRRLRPELDVYRLEREFEDECYEERKEKERKKEAAEKELKKKLDNVAVVSKSFFMVLLVCVLWFVGLVLSNLLTLFFSWAFSKGVDKSILWIVLSELGAIVTVFGLVWFVGYLREKLPEKKFNIIFAPFIFLNWLIFKILIKKVIWEFFCKIVIGGIIEGIVEGFREFGGIFSDYMNASYSDYCPGISWEEKEEEK